VLEGRQQRFEQGLECVGKPSLAQVLGEVLCCARRQQDPTPPRQAAGVRHQALARFGEGSVLLERFTQLATGLAQHVSQRNMPSLQSDRQNLGVHPIVLSSV
jgi:hypothetical protein